jgi:hypothetical protein
VTYFGVISQRSGYRLKICLKSQFSLPKIRQLIPGLPFATLQKPVFVVISFMHWRYIFLLHRSTFFFNNTDTITPVSQFRSSSCLNINLFLQGVPFSYWTVKPRPNASPEALAALLSTPRVGEVSQSMTGARPIIAGIIPSRKSN